MSRSPPTNGPSVGSPILRIERRLDNGKAGYRFERIQRDVRKLEDRPGLWVRYDRMWQELHPATSLAAFFDSMEAERAVFFGWAPLLPALPFIRTWEAGAAIYRTFGD